MVSNGEYVPVPQTAKQKQVEARIQELSERGTDRGNLQQRFKSVPADYEKRMSVDLKKTLELPGFQSDNMSRIKEQYAAIGAEPSNTRYGWIHL